MRLKNSHRWKHSLGLQILICWVLLSSSAWSVQARRGTQIRFDTRAQQVCLEQRAGERPPWLASRFAIRAQQIRAERLRETVLLYENGVSTPVSRFFALRRGYTLVDLSDDWVPRLLRSNDVRGTIMQSAYAAQYVALSNDKEDIEGMPLATGAQNDLEVYGISPSLSALQVRFSSSAQSRCAQKVAPQGLTDGSVRLFFYGQQTALAVRLSRQKAYVDAFLKKYPESNAKTLATKNRRFKALWTRYQTLKKKHDVVAFIEDKLVCEKLMAPRRDGQRTRLNQALADAIRRFQRRHKITDSKLMSPDTVAALQRSTLGLHYRAFVRAITVRVNDAAGIIEDGSVGAVQYRGQSGELQPVPNLAARFSQRLLQATGVTDEAELRDFYGALKKRQLNRFLVAVRLPEKPEYYAKDMPLRIEIDRGTVWYEFPWRASGVRIRQKRPNMPMLTLYTRYRGQDIPLVRWPTTIGGWHAEKSGSGGQEYLSYKNSDVGDRVIRDVVAAPVWLPPQTTPGRTLVHRKRDANGQLKLSLKKHLLGPGYQSAFGLVAGYLVIPGQTRSKDIDRGIRIHGSSNYTSITNQSAFSHGCHRMRNDQVTRLFGFVVDHRPHTVDGPIPSYFKVNVLAHGRKFTFDPKTRGFRYRLEPPLPVTVNEGDVRGRLSRPTRMRFPKPRRKSGVAAN